jgi:very-short-patch-repair endonuclease
MTTSRRYTAAAAEAKGWKPGTSLENQVALQLSRYGFKPDQVAQQHPVEGYRLDFAWPRFKLALEADGWHHRSPEGAARDARRDSMLRAADWLVFRVDDLNPDSLTTQVARVAQAVRLFEDRGAANEW